MKGNLLVIFHASDLVTACQQIRESVSKTFRFMNAPAKN